MHDQYIAQYSGSTVNDDPDNGMGLGDLVNDYDEARLDAAGWLDAYYQGGGALEWANALEAQRLAKRLAKAISDETGVAPCYCGEFHCGGHLADS